jgi:hypothetical protein
MGMDGGGGAYVGNGTGTGIINNRNRQWRRRGIATGGERLSTQIVWDLSAFLIGNKSVKTRLEGVELKVRNERKVWKIGSRGRPPVDLQ